jgi:hypothetical protein
VQRAEDSAVVMGGQLGVFEGLTSDISVNGKQCGPVAASAFCTQPRIIYHTCGRTFHAARR